MTLTQAYILLAIAIAGEIISTGTLKATDQVTLPNKSNTIRNQQISPEAI